MDELRKIAELYEVDLSIPHKMPYVFPNTTRIDLAKLFSHLGYKVGAEIGVEKGYYSETICQNNPGVKLYCVDVWEPFPGYRDLENNKDADQNFSKAQKRLKPYNVEFVKEFSMDAVKHFPDNSLDFVYIDADHKYHAVVDDLFYWSKKVRVGGIISGHDYRLSHGSSDGCHVLYAVDGFARSYKIYPWFLVGPDKVGRSKSFLWVKK
jgi:predicted O-methyltransferase YrrM